ncbi:MAG: ribonuclease P protein component [Erysipelotrichales bacterium]|nr:ribonuclease P protein component [Erysipelotrichales bacterium]
MKKIYRIKKNTEIEELVKKKKSVGNKYFVIYYAANKHDHFRYCVSVSKKYGIAVERNKIKRQIRAILAARMIYYAKNDFLVAIKPTSKELPFDKIEENINYLLIKSGILRREKHEE